MARGFEMPNNTRPRFLSTRILLSLALTLTAAGARAGQGPALALLDAIPLGDTGPVRRLLGDGTSPDASGPDGTTALHWAAQSDAVELARDLQELAKGDDPPGLLARKLLTLETAGTERDALIAIGGEDTLGVANKLTDLGVPVVGVPKTIDNDLNGTDYTFGFDTAVNIVTEAIDRIHTTAESHNRVMVIEVMGRHSGWIALHAGLAGGADMILIPEQKYRVDELVETIRKRHERGKDFSIVVVAEGVQLISEQGKDDEYVKSLKKQGDDIDLLLERMAGQAADEIDA